MKPEEWEISPLLNARDISKILHCSVPHVYKMADRGQLNGERRPRNVVRFKKSDVFDFLEAHYGK
jgi:excisionase family DNA binding protein